MLNMESPPLAQALRARTGAAEDTFQNTDLMSRESTGFD